MEGNKNSEIAVVMVPFPAQGHLNSLLHLSHIIASYNIPVHLAGSTTHNRQAKLRLQGWDSECTNKIHFHDFQLPTYSSPPPNPDSSTPFPLHLLPLFETSSHLREPFCQLLQQLSPMFRRVVVIYDSGMASAVQDVKLIIPNAESYNFMPLSAFTLFLSFWRSLAEKPFQLESDVLPSCLPSDEGCIPPELAEWSANQSKYLGLESGRLYNTSRLIEGKYVELLEKLTAGTDIKHFAIGPFNPAESGAKQKCHRCLEWLDEQEKSSVVYVSFGSTTTLRDEQIRELAIGLEKSEQKFIWVLRIADKGDLFTESEEKRLQLPEGFEERVTHRGMLVRDWAPQLEILAHPSTGAFMSHCGWNSCIESISSGVPIAAWPMHSDQPKNAALVTEVLKIGTLVRDWAHRAELVSSTAIENAVRILMVSNEGKVMRKKASELSEAIRGSVTRDGVSSPEMDAFIAHITR